MADISEEQLNTIAERIVDNLVEKRRAQWVDPETHYQHHQWVRGRLESQKRFRDLMAKILLSACIWAIPLILGWLALTSWQAIVEAIRAALQ